MNPKRIAPEPIFDNLEHIGNPFYQKHFTARDHISDALYDEIGDADTDLEYALKFLYSYNGSLDDNKGSTATFNSYRREIERLIQWSWHIEQISVISLKREQIEEFIKFCKKPYKAWIGTKNVARFKKNDEGLRAAHPDWRPFVMTLSKEDFKLGKEIDKDDYTASQAKIKGIFTALSSFYRFLIEENIIETNPVLSIKQKTKYIRKKSEKSEIRVSNNIGMYLPHF